MADAESRVCRTCLWEWVTFHWGEGDYLRAVRSLVIYLWVVVTFQGRTH